MYVYMHVCMYMNLIPWNPQKVVSWRRYTNTLVQPGWQPLSPPSASRRSLPAALDAYNLAGYASSQTGAAHPRPG